MIDDPEDNDDLSKFLSDPEDEIKPIDVGNAAPPISSDDKTPRLENAEREAASKPPEDVFPPRQPAPEAEPPEKAAEPAPPAPAQESEEPGKPEKPGGFQFGNPFSAKLAAQKDDRKQEEADNRDEEPPEPEEQDTPDHLKAQDTNRERNIIKAGEYCDLLEKDPTLKRVKIAAGWDQKSVATEVIDIDLSLFLLDKKDMTRVDEDFIFYNNPRACDSAIIHKGDSRTGAGQGDDESVHIDLNGVPFDLLKIMIVLSIYDEEIRGYNFSMVKNLYVRIVNLDDNGEICRFKVDEERMVGGTGMYAAVMIREGPKWIFETIGKPVNGGLAAIATEYGMVIRELQSTGVRALEQEDGEENQGGEQPKVRTSAGEDAPEEKPINF